jgi:hypothetical protein
MNIVYPDYPDLVAREIVADTNGIYSELETYRLVREALERASDAIDSNGRAGVLPIALVVDLILAMVRAKDQQAKEAKLGGADVVELRRP